MRSLPLTTACQLLLFVLIRKSVCQTAVAVGCFNDRLHEWAFFWWGPGREYARHSATSCARYCSQQKFLYAGMTGRMGLDCHCGNGGYDIYGPSGSCGGCNQRQEAFGCGRSDGDPNRLMFVYKIEPPVEDVDERRVGCWTSSHAPNVLAPQAQLTDLPANNLTVDACINKCRQSSQRYSGLYAGTECWCGSDLQWQGVGRSPAHTANCNIPCPSNSTEMCGGSNFINIFRSALTPVLEPKTTTTTTTGQPTVILNEGSNDKEKKGSSKGVSIGAGVGAVVLLALIVLMIVFMRRRRQKLIQARGVKHEDTAPTTRPPVLAIGDYEYVINTLHPVGQLMQVMKQKNKEEDPFYEEFQNLPKHNPAISANNLGNINPNSGNRVILQNSKKNCYINASYIKNYKGQAAYIAAQGPLSSNVDEFLQMVWQENVSKIIMVTNLFEEGKEKCEQYWPKEDGSPEVVREIVLKKTDEIMFPDYVVRTFMVTKGRESRQVKHFMFSDWSDLQSLTCTSSVLSMLEMVKNNEVEDGSLYYNEGLSISPWLVHCSDGVGRTGTFIALDYLLDQAKAEAQVDVYECVYKLRGQRINMVQSLDQYRFIYIALLKALVIGPTSIACYNFEDTLKELQEPNPETHKSKLFVQFEALEVLKPKHKKTEITEALKPENRDKNRSSEYIPTNQFRPTFDTTYKGSTGYINAVAVKGYKTKFAFLATQLPLENTRQDFWCMVFDYRCPVIVVLQCPEEEIYWPQNENESISYGEFTVQCLTTQRLAGQNINKLTLAVRHKERTPTTTVLLQVDWPPEVSLLEPKTFFAINDLITTHQHGKSALPVVIQCMYGYARSGLVCALNCLIDMINAEQQADVFQCVQHIRSTRPHFIHSFEQFKFLYSATVYYISTLDSYANFKKL